MCFFYSLSLYARFDRMSRLVQLLTTAAVANAGWAFGGAVPMGAAGMQAAPRPLGLGTGNVSFAQSLGAAQNSTTLDPS